MGVILAHVRSNDVRSPLCMHIWRSTFHRVGYAHSLDMDAANRCAEIYGEFHDLRVSMLSNTCF